MQEVAAERQRQHVGGHGHGHVHRKTRVSAGVSDPAPEVCTNPPEIPATRTRISAGPAWVAPLCSKLQISVRPEVTGPVTNAVTRVKVPVLNQSFHPDPGFRANVAMSSRAWIVHPAPEAQHRATPSEGPVVKSLALVAAATTAARPPSGRQPGGLNVRDVRGGHTVSYGRGAERAARTGAGHVGGRP